MALTQFQFTGADWTNPDPCNHKYYECINEAIMNRWEISGFGIAPVPCPSENIGLLVSHSVMAAWKSNIQTIVTYFFNHTLNDLHYHNRGGGNVPWTEEIDLDPHTPRYKQNGTWYNMTEGVYIIRGTGDEEGTDTVYVFSFDCAIASASYTLTGTAWTWDAILTEAGLTELDLVIPYAPCSLSDPVVSHYMNSCYKVLNLLRYSRLSSSFSIGLTATDYMQEYRRCKERGIQQALYSADGGLTNWLYYDSHPDTMEPQPNPRGIYIDIPRLPPPPGAVSFFESIGSPASDGELDPGDWLIDYGAVGDNPMAVWSRIEETGCDGLPSGPTGVYECTEWGAWSAETDYMCNYSDGEGGYIWDCADPIFVGVPWVLSGEYIRPGWGSPMTEERIRSYTYTSGTETWYKETYASRTCITEEEIINPTGGCATMCQIAGGKVANLSYSASVEGWQAAWDGGGYDGTYMTVEGIGNAYGETRFLSIAVQSGLEGISNAYDCNMTVNFSINSVPTEISGTLQKNDAAGSAWPPVLTEEQSLATNTVLATSMGVKALPNSIPNSNYTHTTGAGRNHYYTLSAGDSVNFYMAYKMILDLNALGILKEVTKFNDSF